MKEARSIPIVLRNLVSGLCVMLLLLFPGGAIVFAQDAAQSPQQPGAPPPQAQLLSPDQLSNLVAPVALYPDNLLSQLLVASTYPLEVAEAAQWLQQNRGLAGSQLMDAARQQNWDASIQALVVFPDVLNRLASDIRWTTDLGNAFLAQQSDVMNAVQRLRSEASASGKLTSTAQQNVTTQTQDGQTAIDIQPTNPQVVYVPVYNPEYIWGPPVYGYYPPLFYPGFALGFGFGPGIFLGGFFGGLGWGGWGWGPNWFGGAIFTNAFFFNHYRFHGWGPGFRGGVWAHNPEHRMGVPYANRAVANRFGGSFNTRGGLSRAGAERGGVANAARGNAAGGARSSAQAGNRGAAGGNWQHFGQSGAGQSGAGARAAQPSARAGQSFGGNNNAFRGGASANHSAPAPRPAPSNSGAFRPSGNAGGNSFHGNAGGNTFRGSNPGGGSFHGGSAPRASAGGGGASHASGGGGSHGGHR